MKSSYIVQVKLHNFLGLTGYIKNLGHLYSDWPRTFLQLFYICLGYELRNN